ncbi:VOC family protein [Amphritea pacifica]|uniref:VOC family protein n=1 Tax=Amphritea pacifica TaxID=2811233 RepID=A0ABS2W6L5_9GAMM|nr:VOC family protein [Amphritea pacifica]MBN0987344.1 VOC family protein [Amphritea pacifica]MBN1006096.1 VOC family protein [Amphritea pacifica]
MTLNIAGIDHIVLRTTQLEEMLAFYCGVLGCIVERELPPKTGLVQLRAGTALIDLVIVDSELGREGGGAPAPTENNLDHFCLLLEPISEDEIRKHLKEHKIAFGDFTERYGSEGFGLSTYIQDPEGNTVELRSKNR